MQTDALLAEAQKGGFFSYIAGVAYQIATHYRVRGLVIDNDRTDLPVKKGLSSSAAICVLTARAFNKIYDLKMTIRGEMEYAYLGEIVTPWRCGRMDQGCAFGDRPILMTHDRDLLGIRELRVGADLYLLRVRRRASSAKQWRRLEDYPLLIAALVNDTTVHPKIDLRPLGLRIYDDAQGLHLGGNVLWHNAFTDCSTAIALD